MRTDRTYHKAPLSPCTVFNPLSIADGVHPAPCVCIQSITSFHKRWKALLTSCLGGSSYSAVRVIRTSNALLALPGSVNVDMPGDSPEPSANLNSIPLNPISRPTDIGMSSDSMLIDWLSVAIWDSMGMAMLCIASPNNIVNAAGKCSHWRLRGLLKRVVAMVALGSTLDHCCPQHEDGGATSCRHNGKHLQTKSKIKEYHKTPKWKKWWYRLKSSPWKWSPRALTNSFNRTNQNFLEYHGTT